MQALHGLEFEQLVEHLPSDFEVLRRDAVAEGKRFLERLYSEWQSGEQRFSETHEVLLTARVSGELAGIGGMTIDPDMPSAMRMRRFFVRPAYRRHGLGRQLAAAILDRSIPSGTMVTAHTDSAEAAAFWEAIGFRHEPRDGFTHFLLYRGSGDMRSTNDVVGPLRRRNMLSGFHDAR